MLTLRERRRERTDLAAEREHQRRDQQEPRHQRAKAAVAEPDQQQRANAAADQSDNRERKHFAEVGTNLRTVGCNAGEIGRSQRNRAGGVGIEGRQTARDQSREGDERAAAGNSIDRARGESRHRQHNDLKKSYVSPFTQEGAREAPGEGSLEQRGIKENAARRMPTMPLCRLGLRRTT